MDPEARPPIAGILRSGKVDVAIREARVVRVGQRLAVRGAHHVAEQRAPLSRLQGLLLGCARLLGALRALAPGLLLTALLLGLAVAVLLRLALEVREQGQDAGAFEQLPDAIPLGVQWVQEGDAHVDQLVAPQQAAQQLGRQQRCCQGGLDEGEELVDQRRGSRQEPPSRLRRVLGAGPPPLGGQCVPGLGDELPHVALEHFLQRLAALAGQHHDGDAVREQEQMLRVALFGEALQALERHARGCREPPET
mmetsp:Transcript_166487/g.534912  ORF Transcript_166487/g.534912 Transcript_166487/m.534912 type:complete len:251 (-) Transcript_166487:805-1557(-)